jgi:PAS domain S-box-containing protein
MRSRKTPLPAESADHLSLFRKIAEQAPIAMAVVGMDGAIEFINRKAVQVFGYAHEDIPNMDRWWVQAYPDETYRKEVVARWTALVEKAVTEGQEIPGNEYRVTCEDGTVKTMVISGAYISDKVFVLFDDFSERKQAEEALRKSEEKFSQVFRTSPDSIVIARLSDGKILDVNQGFTDTTGFTPEDVLGRSSLSGGLDLWPNPEDRNRMVAGLTTHGQVIGMEAPLRTKNGGVCTALLSARIIEIDGQQCVLLVGRDITQRKRTEEALRVSEQHYRMISELTTDYVYHLSVAADGQVTMDFVSDNFAALTGRTREDTLTTDLWRTIIHPDDLGKVMGLLQKLVVTPQSAELECRSFICGGKPRWVNVIARSEWDEQAKRVTGIVGAVKDISERKHADEAIAAERERLAVTLRSIGDGVITTDITGNIVLMNSVAEDLTGWRQVDAQGQPLATAFSILDATTRQPCESPVARVLSTGQVVDLANPTLLTVRNGGERLIANTAAPIKDRDGQTIGVVLVFRDMTERQRSLDAMQRAARLDSLGVLAGGIAHDFNNLLGGIFGNIDLARSEARDPAIIEHLDATLATMSRARALTLQLLTFAKGGAPIQRVTPLTPFLQETAQFALSGSSVSCRFSLPERLWSCNIDKNQIAQVIDNIIINAQQAMPGGGAVEVAAANVAIEEGQVHSLAKGNYVRLSFKDRGIGIPREILPRIFDPFYTTKTKGHGLGLATCYSIVSRHGGCIDVESEPGRGSTFHVYLPASSEVGVVIEDQRVRHQGSGTIIVVDDEEVIRTTVRRMVEALGYSAVCRRDGAEAIDLYIKETRAGRKFAAIILDLTIRGGMGGREAVAEIRKVDEKVPVFVASGYADDPVMTDPVKFGFTASICKPFTIADLAKMLSQNLKS